MSNLLKDASILLTPTGYDNGSMNAIKPEIALGEELVVNGDFATDLSGWDDSGGVSILWDSGRAKLTTTATGYIKPISALTTVIGAKYRLLVTLTGTGNTANVRAGTTSLGIDLFNSGWGVTDGSHAYSFTATTTTTYIAVGNGFANVSYIDNVSVKEDLSGDFQFSRNSAATRVNAQGLVQNVQILSSNLVSNGDFSQEGVQEVSNGSFSQEGVELLSQPVNLVTDFTTNSGGVIVDADTFTTSGGGLDGIKKSFLTVGKYYKLVIEGDTTSSGFTIGSLGNSGNEYGSGFGTHYFECINSGLWIRQNTSGTTNITSFSVKEVGQDWDLETGWSIGDDKATSNGTINKSVIQTNVFTIGKFYKINFTISDAVGSLDTRIWMLTGGAKIEANANGDYTTYWKADGTDLYATTLSTNTATYSISNISVKEVGQDWTTTDSDANNYVEFGDGTARLKFLNTSPITKFTSTAQYISGKKYKLTVNVKEVVSGGIKIDAAGVQQTYNSVGIQESIIEPTGNSFISFYRATANVDITLNSVSLIEITDNTNLPRINYEGFSYDTNGDIIPNSGCGSWLMEGQSTNLFTYSEDLSSSWTFINVNKTLKQVENPSGTLGAYEIAANSTVTSHYIELNPYSATSGVDYTFSFFAKINGSNFVQVASSTGFSPLYQNFNLLDGTLGNGNLTSGYSSSIEPFGNGWYRVSVKGTTISANARFLTVPILTDIASRNPSFNGDGTLGVYVWGFQKEQNSFPTSYIPTSGAASTRLQDIATNSGNASLINSSEGVLYAEISTFNNSSTLYKCISVSDGTTSNRAFMRYNVGTNDIFFAYVSNGVTIATFNSVGFVNISDFNKLAFSWKLNQFKAYINGSQISTTITSGSVSSGFSELNFNDGSINPFYGKNKALAVYKTALTDANLRSLTYPPAVATTFDLDFDTIAEQFTFTRGSEATFVNAQGLIQSTNEIGSELVTNGDFATDSDWDKGSGITISGGSANFTGVPNANINQNVGLVTGKTYKIVFTISNYVSGSIDYNLGGSTRRGNISGDGTFTDYVVSNSNQFLFFQSNPSLGFTGSIDNVSVKEHITATNTPRLDYSTGSEAFLLEPQSTNLVPYSEDFSQWDIVRATSTANASVSPEGASNAYKLQSSVTSNNGSWYREILSSFSGNYEFSVFAKAGATNFLQLRVDGIGGVIFDLGDGAIKSQANAVGSVSDYGNGWYKCSIQLTASSSTTLLIIVGNENMTSSTWNTTIGDSIYLYGAQLEQQSYATSYIPTQGASATRNQELCNDATPVINSEEGTLYAEISALADDNTSRTISINNGASNRVFIQLRSTTGQVNSGVIVGGALQGTSMGFVVSQTSNIKLAIKYKLNDFAFWVNGVEVGTVISGNVFPSNTLNDLSFDSGGGAEDFFGNTKDLKYYPKALADVQLEDLTTI